MMKTYSEGEMCGPRSLAPCVVREFIHDPNYNTTYELPEKFFTTFGTSESYLKRRCDKKPYKGGVIERSGKIAAFIRGSNEGVVVVDASWLNDAHRSGDTTESPAESAG
jgi:hypothetical protein